MAKIAGFHRLNFVWAAAWAWREKQQGPDGLKLRADCCREWAGLVTGDGPKMLGLWRRRWNGAGSMKGTLGFSLCWLIHELASWRCHVRRRCRPRSWRRPRGRRGWNARLLRSMLGEYAGLLTKWRQTMVACRGRWTKRERERDRGC